MGKGGRRQNSIHSTIFCACVSQRREELKHLMRIAGLKAIVIEAVDLAE